MRHAQILAAFLAFFGLTSIAPAQLFLITEVLISSIGGVSEIEMRNIGAPGSAAGRILCISVANASSYAPLPSGGAIPTGGLFRVRLNTSGTNTVTQLFVPGLPNLIAGGGAVTLFNGSPLFPFSVEDYVSYGTNTAHLVASIAAGQWTVAGSVPAPPTPLQSIAYDGSGNGPEDWYFDATPTLGQPNEVGDFLPFGTGCSGSAGMPLLLRSPAQRPFIGASLDTVVSSCPPSALTAALFATSLGGPLDLGFLGAPGCPAYVTTIDFALVSVASIGGTAGFSLPLPSNPALVGLLLYQQALVFDALANPFGASVSNPGLAVIGSN